MLTPRGCVCLSGTVCPPSLSLWTSPPWPLTARWRGLRTLRGHLHWAVIHVKQGAVSLCPPVGVPRFSSVCTIHCTGYRLCLFCRWFVAPRCFTPAVQGPLVAPPLQLAAPYTANALPCTLHYKVHSINSCVIGSVHAAMGPARL